MGPYSSEEDAEEENPHLQQTHIHLLNTRDRNKARRILKDRMQGGSESHSGSDSMASDEPINNSPSLVQRFRDLIQPARNNDEDED